MDVSVELVSAETTKSEYSDGRQDEAFEMARSRVPNNGI